MVVTRASRRLAWGLWAATVALALGASALAIVNRGQIAGTHAAFDVTQALVTLVFPTVGALIASNRPENAIGWILIGAGLIIEGAGYFLGQYAIYALATRPGSLPGGASAFSISNVWWAPALGLIAGYTILLFPHGHVPSPRWRWVAWTLGMSIGAITLSFLLVPGPIESGTSLHPDNPFGIEGWKNVLQTVAAIGILVLLGIVVASAVALVQRLRRAQGDERQQLEWFVYAATLLALAFVVGLVLDAFGLETARAVLLGVAVFGIPIGAGIAILKYRLYDIDLVINRTVLFGILAAFVTVVYVAVVIGIGALIGSKSNVGLSVVATAIIALAFQPARNRARHLANRLVYGKRATPYEVLSDFSDRVAGTYAAEDVLPRMAQILGQGIGSRESQVWLRVGRELRAAAAWPIEGSNGSTGLPLAGDERLPDFPEADEVCPVMHQGELLGALVVTMPRGEAFTPVQRKLLEDLGLQAGLVLRNVRLIEELRASRQRLVAAQDEERRRLERNLHDGAQQQLVALAIKAKLAQAFVGRDDERVRDIIGEVQADAGETLESLRDLARGIYPPLLADQGLTAALQAQTRKAAIPVEVVANGLGRYPRDVEAAVYFCCLEALQNVAKYAGASRAVIRFEERDGALTFTVEDDGDGFDPQATPMGTGVQGMADRLDALSGRLEVRSELGRGTTVTGRLPLTVTGG